jgi:hypothetical protein
MTNENKKIHQPHDKGYKYILKIKSEFIKLLKGFIEEKWVDSVNEENITMIDKSFIDTHFQSKEADIVYKYTDGVNETIFYVLLEHQSTVDNKMMFRLLVYMMEIWRDYLNENKLSIAPVENEKEKELFKIPAIIPIVLHTGSRKWNAPVSFSELIKNSEKYNGHIVNFESLLIDTAPIKDEKFLEQKSVISLVMYLDKAKDLKDFLEKYPVAAMILNTLNAQERRMLIKWLRDIFKQRFDKDTVKRIEAIFQETNPVEVKKMVTNLERVIEREQEERYLAGKIDTAIEMLKDGVSVSLVKKYTSLSEAEILKLKKNLFN